jgi:hypothetical protein
MTELATCKKCGAVMKDGDPAEVRDCPVCLKLADINNMTGHLQWPGWTKESGK